MPFPAAKQRPGMHRLVIGFEKKGSDFVPKRDLFVQYLGPENAAFKSRNAFVSR
jgi:hypothetical protein